MYDVMILFSLLTTCKIWHGKKLFSKKAINNHNLNPVIRNVPVLHANNRNYITNVVSNRKKQKRNYNVMSFSVCSIYVDFFSRKNIGFNSYALFKRALSLKYECAKTIQTADNKLNYNVHLSCGIFPLLYEAERHYTQIPAFITIYTMIITFKYRISYGLANFPSIDLVLNSRSQFPCRI